MHHRTDEGLESPNVFSRPVELVSTDLYRFLPQTSRSIRPTRSLEVVDDKIHRINLSGLVHLAIHKIKFNNIRWSFWFYLQPLTFLMQEVFIPDLVASYRWLSLCLIFGVAGVLLAVLAFRQNKFPLRPVAQLMGMMLGMVGLLGAGFILWNNARTPTVVVTNEFLILGNDTIPNVMINKAYIETVSDYNMMGEPSTDEIGILELSNGRTQLFDSEVYDVKKLMRSIQRVK